MGEYVARAIGLKRKNRSISLTWARDRENKVRTVQEGTTWLYYTCLGRNPTEPTD